MSDASTAQRQMVTELKVSAHLMTLDAGVYCVSHSPGSTEPDPQTGLPGACLSVPPGPAGKGVTISGFRADGWLGSPDAAALIRVSHGPAQVLMTVYQEPGSKHEAPRLQVTRLTGPAEAAPAPVAEGPAIDPTDAEVAAHVQRRGDVLARLGEWIGQRGSNRWVEGFALAPRHGSVAPEDIEYQAVLGRGWLSPWAEGGQFCGSRGMALPILGLRVRLRGKAAETHRLAVSASFTDGTQIGPVAGGEACEAPNLAPLEAFCVELLPIAAARAERKPAPPPVRAAAMPVARPASARPAPAAKATPKPAPAKPPAKAAPKRAPAPVAKPKPKTAKTAARGRSR